MVSNDLVEISLRDGGEEINLRRPNSQAPVLVTEVASVVQTPVAALPAGVLPPVAPPPEPAEDDAELAEIVSPMVGTFYASPDPDSPAFVRAGQEIQIGMVICIVEAMKVFNEIKAEIAGTVERILVKNADAIEFGQPLFVVRPS